MFRIWSLFNVKLKLRCRLEMDFNTRFTGYLRLHN